MKNLIISKTKEGRKENMKKKVTVILCSLLMVLLVGCGGNSSTLVGAWTTDAEGMEEENAYFELYSDGTGLIKEDMGSSALEWIAENGKLKLTIDAGLFGKVAVSYSYTLSENTLILTDDDGTDTTFTKVE